MLADLHQCSRTLTGSVCSITLEQFSSILQEIRIDVLKMGFSDVIDENIMSTPEPAILEESQVLTTFVYDLQESTEFSSLGNRMDNASLDHGWSFRPITWSWWVIVQMISAVLGIIGNGLVMIILFQRRAKSRSTDTLVGGLAAADFLTSVSVIPVPKAISIPPNGLGTLYCKIQEPNIPKEIFVIASIYILVAISTERYIAIVHPIYFNRILTRRRVATGVLIIFAFAILLGFLRIFTIYLDDVRGICIYQYANRASQVTLAIYLFSLRLLVPASVMLITQILIAKHLHLQARRFKGQQTTSFHDVARQRVLKMMLIVIISYVICWGPNQVTVILYFFGVLPRSFRGSPVFSLLIVLSFFNSCLNPIIYAVRFKEFRSAVWDMFRRQKTSRSAIFEQDTTGGISQRDPSTAMTTNDVPMANAVRSPNLFVVSGPVEEMNLRNQ